MSEAPIRPDEMPRLKKAARFIDQHFSEGIRLPDIAAQAGMSSFHFHRRFKLYHGRTPKDWILHRQIECAQRLILKGEKLAEIAKSCGFSHQSHFSSRFKAATGLAPMAWRRANQRRGSR